VGILIQEAVEHNIGKSHLDGFHAMMSPRIHGAG